MKSGDRVTLSKSSEFHSNIINTIVQKEYISFYFCEKVCNYGSQGLVFVNCEVDVRDLMGSLYTANPNNNVLTRTFVLGNWDEVRPMVYSKLFLLRSEHVLPYVVKTIQNSNEDNIKNNYVFNNPSNEIEQNSVFVFCKDTKKLLSEHVVIDADIDFVNKYFKEI